MYRLYLIESQNKAFSEIQKVKFINIVEYIEKKDLWFIDLPDELDSFDSFILKMKIKNFLKGKNDS